MMLKFMCFKSVAVVLTLCAISLATDPNSDGSKITLQELFQNARNYQRSIPPYACDVEVNDSANSTDLTTDKAQGKSLISFRKDNGRVDAIIKQYIPNEKTTIFYEKRTFWDGKQSFVYQQQGMSKKLISAVVSSSEEMYRRILFDQSTGAFLEGKFWHNPDVGDWIDLLKKGETVSFGVNKEPVNGYSCDVINAHTPYGDYKLWIDTASGYNIRRAEIAVESNDIAWGKKVGALPDKESPKSFSKIQMDITDVTIKKIEGYYFPVGGTLSTRLTYSDGSVFIKKEMIKRTNIQWNPDFDAIGAFKINLPEGSIVTNKILLASNSNGGVVN
jgi:hypothetical protein